MFVLSLFLFCNQSTAYELRIGDWSSDVCSSELYYRDAKGEIWKDFADFAGNDGWPRAREMRGHLDAEAIMRDAAAAVGWLDTQGPVDTARGVGRSDKRWVGEAGVRRRRTLWAPGE